jgi:hypothetical protein
MKRTLLFLSLFALPALFVYAQNNQPATPIPSAVILITANGTATTLIPTLTTITRQAGFMEDFTKYYSAHIPGVHATIRITDAKPQLRITLAYSPENICFLVRLTQDRHMFIKQKNRVLDLAAGHDILSRGSAAPEQPIKTSIVPTTCTHNADGTWTLSPITQLAPGEYALYIPAQSGYSINPGTAFDFGVDAPQPTAPAPKG